MSEEQIQPVSLGKVEKVNFNIEAARQAEQQHQGANENGGAEQKTPEQIEAEKKEAESKLTGQKTPEEIKAAEDAIKLANEEKEKGIRGTLTDEQLKEEYEKRFPTKEQKTEEEKKKDEAALEKRMLDYYVEGGGTLDQFALQKTIMGLDLTELGKAELSRELKAAGFDEEQIKAIQQERLTQLSEDDLTQFEDETKKEFEKRKREYDLKQVQARGEKTKNQATEFFKILTEAVADKDLAEKQETESQNLKATKEKEFSSNVEEHFNKVERKLTLQLGKVNDTDVPPVEYEVPTSVIDEAKDLLKDPAKRQQFLYNQDGDLNLQNLSDIILKAKMFDTAMKTTYLEGGNRQVEIFKKVFPMGSAYAVGIGSGTQKNNPKTPVVSVGKSQRVTRSVVNQ